MVEIISIPEDNSKGNKMGNMFPKLESLKLAALGNLEKFCISESYIEFPCLRYLGIENCNKLGPFIVDPMMSINVRDTIGHHLFDQKVSSLGSLIIIFIAVI